MNIETVITLIATIGGLSGLISAISTIVFKVLEYRKAQRGDTIDAKLSPLINKLDKQETELHEIRLDTTRTQMLMLMEHQPHNHDTIIKVAERYFCQLNGNWVAASEFMAWAQKEDVNIPPHLWAAVAQENLK